MNNCWNVLQIAPTIDTDAIKSARRSLMKKWHPDLAREAADKALYTARCVEINAAFDQAMVIAKAWKPARIAPDPAAKPDRRVRVARYEVNPVASMGSLAAAGMLFFVLASRTGFRLFLMSVSFTMAMGVVAAFDWFFLRGAIRPLLRNARDPYHSTAAWLLLSTTNVVLLSFGLAEIATLLFGFVGAGVFDVAVGVVIPVWLSAGRRLPSPPR